MFEYLPAQERFVVALLMRREVVGRFKFFVAGLASEVFIGGIVNYLLMLKMNVE